MISLGLACAAAVLLPVIWSVSRSDPLPPPRPPTLPDTELDWRCERGHVFLAAGQVGRRLCSMCDQLASPMTYYACPVQTHGPFRVEVEFTPDDDLGTRVARLRLIGRQWFSVEEGVRCPQCDRLLIYEPSKSLRMRLVQPQDTGD